LTAESRQVKHTADKLADYRRLADALERLLPAKGRLIEVGSFSGVLTAHLKRAGWDAAGIEPDGRAVDYAKATYDIEVHRCTLETVVLPPASVDAIVMLHVIEHVDDPTTNVRRARELLRDGGIFVIETPTYDSLSYRILGRRERSINVDGHISFYTTKTLRDLLEMNGYSILRCEKVGRTMSIGRLLHNVGIMSKSRTLESTLKSISDRWGLENRYVYLNMRDMIRIYAAKV
jgi:2-polyprenyl-3-methyl-5-hydroxy-6-metoxy-1,4-benzoquinol methylase